MQKITPFLWYSKEAEEAAAFYAGIFPDSRVVRVTAMPSESPTSAISMPASSSWVANVASYAVSMTMRRPSAFIARNDGTVTGLRVGALVFCTYTTIPSERKQRTIIPCAA